MAYAVGVERQHILGRGLGGHHRDLAAALRQHAQDVGLHAEVIRHHVEAWGLLLAVAGFAVFIRQHPLGLRPGVGFVAGNHLGQVEASHAGSALGGGNGLVDDGLCYRLPRSEADDAAVLCALGAQQTGELAGVDVGDGDSVLTLKISRQRQLRAEVAGNKRQILDDEAAGKHFASFHVLRVDAVVADVRIGERDDLVAVTRIGEDFLIAGDRGVEHHLAHGLTAGTDGCTDENRAVCESQYRSAGGGGI
jgi:hypothetical protein